MYYNVGICNAQLYPSIYTGAENERFVALHLAWHHLNEY